MCQNFVKEACPPHHPDPDRFIKERLSFVELAFRMRDREIAELNASLEINMANAMAMNARFASLRVPGLGADGVRGWTATQTSNFAGYVDELNERFRRAAVPLTYHNGFIQVSLDEQVERQIAKPFWNLVGDPLWKNVDIDMKEALDRRDSNDKDPAFFAAKALESTIKIISDQKGWTRGNESGASAFIDNLVSKNNGSFIAVWEADTLRDYFKKVRNTLGHGPGSAPMPALTPPQTDWAIESAMSWIRTLIRRMQSTKRIFEL